MKKIHEILIRTGLVVGFVGLLGIVTPKAHAELPDISSLLTPIVDPGFPFAQIGDQISTGTGFFITKDGYGITAAHVVKDTKHNFLVIEGKLVPISIVAINTVTDIAVFKANLNNTTPVPLSDSNIKAQLSDEVNILGYPLPDGYLDNPTYTSGYVSKVDTDMYTITSDIKPGNSGSPVVDSDGNLIGIVNACMAIGKGENAVCTSTDLSEESYRVEELIKNLHLDTDHNYASHSKRDIITNLQKSTFMIVSIS